MAIEKGGKRRGRVANLSYRVNRGKQIVQSRPGKGKIKLSVASTKTAGVFGRSSSLAGTIRKSLGTLIGTYYDTDMVSNFTKTVHNAVKQCYDPSTEAYNFATDSFKNVVGFNFNAHSRLEDSLWLSPESTLANNSLLITLPEQEIGKQLKFPKTSNYCEIVIMCRIYNLRNGLLEKKPVKHKFTADQTQPLLQMQKMEFHVPEGCLCFVGILLEYYLMTETVAVKINSKTFNPAALCTIYVNPGTPKEGSSIEWQKNAKAVFG